MLNKELYTKVVRGTAIAVSAILFMGASFKIADLLSDLQKPNPNKPVAEVVATVDKTAERNATTDGCLDALLRSWALTDACHDEATNNYFVKVADHQPEEGRLNAGWYMLDKYEFIQLQNKTWVIKSYDTLNEVFPDTTGLRCKQQAYIWQKK